MKPAASAAPKDGPLLAILRALLERFPAPPRLLTPADPPDAFADSPAFSDRGVVGVLFVPKRDVLSSSGAMILVPQWSTTVLRRVVMDAVEVMECPNATWARFATGVLAAGDEGKQARSIAAHAAGVVTWPLFTCAQTDGTYSRVFRAFHAQRLRDSIAACGGAEGYGAPSTAARAAHDLDLDRVLSRDRLRCVLAAWSDVDDRDVLDFDELVLAIARLVYFNPCRADNMCFRLRASAAAGSGKSTSLRRVTTESSSVLRMSPVDVGFAVGERGVAAKSIHDMAGVVLDTVLWELRGVDRGASVGRPSMAAEILMDCARRRAASVLDRYLFEVLPRLTSRDQAEYAALQQRTACYVLHFLHVTRGMALE